MTKATDNFIKRYYDINEASVYTSMSPNHIKRAVREGRLKARKTSAAKNGKIVIAVYDLEKFMQSLEIINPLH